MQGIAGYESDRSWGRSMETRERSWSNSADVKDDDDEFDQDSYGPDCIDIMEKETSNQDHQPSIHSEFGFTESRRSKANRLEAHLL